MDIAEMSTPKPSPAWQDLIEAFKKSGLSQTAFCRQEKISYSNFNLQYRKFRRPDRTSDAKKEKFLAVRVNNTTKCLATEIQVTLPNGFRCQIPAGVQANDLKSLI